MFDEAALLQILIDEMPTELECTAQGCNHGEGGANGRLSPLLRLSPWRCRKPTELMLMVNSSVEVVGLLVMVGVKFSLQSYHTL